MADGTEDGTAVKAKSRKKLFIIGGAAAVVILGGAGGYFAFAGGKGGEHGEVAAHGEAADDGHGPVAPKAGEDAPTAAASYVDLPEMTVNLATVDKDKQRYVRLAVALEVDKPEMAQAIKPMMPRVLDSFQTHLRELRPDDIRGSAGVYRLKEELLRRVNTAVAPAKVDAVLFKDIVVQ
ncbi:flagellar basal body-associated FliL family protein [Hansschlegelia zhihuaiae]|nr:flagellar basal body-associated FliL family protein [Hansschlegelia zhihuaiae]